MVADLIPAPDPRLPHVLRLSAQQDEGSCVAEVRQALAGTTAQGEVTLLVGERPLTLPELQSLQGLLDSQGLRLSGLRSDRAETLVAAAALGLNAEEPMVVAAAGDDDTGAAGGSGGLRIHRGTLRAGDHLQAAGSVLLLGDLNPGARISAAGDILVWGRLRGVAHAGCSGDRDARIVALQLRPLQLRIAEAVARGPEEPPQPGMAEQARLVEGEIRIDPAEPGWPPQTRWPLKESTRRP